MRFALTAPRQRPLQAQELDSLTPLTLATTGGVQGLVRTQPGNFDYYYMNAGILSCRHYLSTHKDVEGLHMNWMVRGALRLLDTVFPPVCVRCQLPSKRPVPLCLACNAEMPANTNPCNGCALPLSGKSGRCGACQSRPRSFDHCIAPMLYADPVAGYIQRFKYSGDMTLLALLADLTQGYLCSRLDDGPMPDKLVPMPLHWTRMLQRGFNQSELLAIALARHSAVRHQHLQVDRTLCQRVRNTPNQSGLDYQARRSNMRAAFCCSGQVTDMHIAIVDDVLTTGASAEALATELKNAGASRVDLWCCARTPSPGTSALHE